VKALDEIATILKPPIPLETTFPLKTMGAVTSGWRSPLAYTSFTPGMRLIWLRSLSDIMGVWWMKKPEAPVPLLTSPTATEKVSGAKRSVKREMK
jgi:hypothetical protein